MDTKIADGCWEIASSNLTFEQKEDGSIAARDEKYRTRFEIPKAYMVDAKGNYSEGVSYVLDGNELKIKADSEWIKSATLPVTIKPEIKSVKNEKVTFKSVNESGRKEENGEKIYIGKKNGAEKSDGFLSFKIPKVAPYYELLGAEVQFEYETEGMSVFKGKELSYDVYLANASNLSSISYAEKPEKIESLNGIKSNSSWTTKSATYESEIIDTNKLETDTLTIGIETEESTTNGGYITLATASASTQAVYWFDRIIGIEDEYSMESFSVTGATSYVNNGTGQLTAIFDLASVNTLSDIPFELSLVYNDYYSDIISYIGRTSNCGNNFKLNFEQYMAARGDVYEMVDADGSLSTFHCLSGEKGIYYSQEKKLYYNRFTGRVYDLQNNEMIFNNGRLYKIYSLNNQEEYITITYENNTSDRIKKLDYYAANVLKYSIFRKGATLYAYNRDRKNKEIPG